MQHHANNSTLSQITDRHQTANSISFLSVVFQKASSDTALLSIHYRTKLHTIRETLDILYSLESDLSLIQNRLDVIKNSLETLESPNLFDLSK